MGQSQLEKRNGEVGGETTWQKGRAREHRSPMIFQLYKTVSQLRAVPIQKHWVYHLQTKSIGGNLNICVLCAILWNCHFSECPAQRCSRGTGLVHSAVSVARYTGVISRGFTRSSRQSPPSLWPASFSSSLKYSQERTMWF